MFSPKNLPLFFLTVGLFVKPTKLLLRSICPSYKESLFYQKLYTLCLRLSIILLLTVSCQSSQKETDNLNFSSDEKVWLTQFFEDVMLFESGIYTLWGSSKPLTMIAIEQYTDEEKQAFYDSLTEEEKKSGILCMGYSLDKTWFQWEEIKHRFPMNRYMLFKMKQFQDDHVFFVLFVDILKTTAVIQENYDIFRKAIGVDFHPLEITLSMKQKDCILWEKMNAHLWGILFGFGKMNSYLFQLQHFDHPESCNEFCKNIISFDNDDFTQGQVKYTIDQFSIPSFKSFNEIDPVVDNFREERNRIKEIYKGKDFLELTLKKLME